MNIVELAKNRVLYGGSGGSGGGEDTFPAEKYIEAQHETVELPNATAIKPSAFYNDKTLKNIYMPKVTSIGDGAFNGCSNLALTSLPSGLTTAGTRAFAMCTGITISKIPKGLTRTSSYMFDRCTGITTITFEAKPSGNTAISNNTFIDCTNLTTINVPWKEGEVYFAPWGATNATINYNYTGE